MILPWLAPFIGDFKKILLSAQIPHAFLLSGPAGVGQEELIAQLAQLFICDHTHIAPCGKCRSCHLLAEQSHPDYYCLGEEEQIAGIDEIRNLTEYVSKTPYLAARKVIIIKEVDKLHKNAANALLKTLEEPPATCYFLLLATELNAVMSTIQSRCIKLKLPCPTFSQSLVWLRTLHPNLSEETLEQNLNFAGKAPLAAHQLLEEKVLDKWEDWIAKLLISGSHEAFYHADFQQLIQNEPQKALCLFYYWLSEFILFTLNCSKTSIKKQNCINSYQTLLRKISAKEALNYLTRITQAIQILNLPGTNKMLLFEELFYYWQTLVSGEGNSLSSDEWQTQYAY